MQPDYDVLTIGSGFGGSVTALRLTEKGYRVGVLEAGRRFSDEEFAKTSWNLRKFLWMPKLGMYGIQRIHLLRNVMILAGAGVGGGSLNYANTLYVPPNPFFSDPQWNIRLARRVDAALRPGAAHARRGHQPVVHRCRQDHERGCRRDGRR
jgi:cholesterol oxidase